MNPNLDIIFIIGPQGSGKGTQAKRLAARLGFFYWENGAIIREKAKENNPLGIKTKEVMEAGALLDDAHLFEIVTEKFASLPENSGIIFDGVPRRVTQAEFLVDYLKNHGHKNFTTLYLSLPPEESLARLLKRAEIEHRKDDTPETIATRLKYYETETVPVLEYLKTRTDFIEIDGRSPVDEVTRAIYLALQLT